MSPATLIQGGVVVDGTGTSPVTADVLIEGDRIRAIGANLADNAGTTAAAATVVDATGMLVTPGFVDLHSHADFTLVAFPSADSALRQGITTVATGNCGGGVAPVVSPHDVRSVAFAHSDDWGVDITWRSFGEYTTHLDGAGVNVAPLVAHGAIRNAVRGMTPGPASASEVATMGALLESALDDGAFGLSTGFEYRPGCWAGEEEIRALVQRVGERGRMYATHMRNRAEHFDDAVAEAMRAVSGTGAHLQLSHFAPRPYAPPEQVDAAFVRVTDAVSAGERIGVDTFPEVWGPALLIDLLPEDVMTGTTAEVLARLRDAAPGAHRPNRTADHIADHIENRRSFLARIGGYAGIHLTGMPEPDDRTGRTLEALAVEAGVTVSDLCITLLLEAGALFRMVGIRHIYATGEALRRTMALPFCSIESDGIVTPGEDLACPLTWSASSYGYTARMLSHWIRSEKLLSLEEGVRRMTGLPATALGIHDRGTLHTGGYADVVVIDPDQLRDRSTPDHVARHPIGFHRVFVNGVAAVVDDSVTQVTGGRLLTP